MRLRTRRTICMSVILAALIVGGITFLAGGSRITHDNYSRIQIGASKAEVIAILGEPNFTFRGPAQGWRDGPDWIGIGFEDEQVVVKKLHLATAWETITWYGKKGAEKIGVKWD